MQIKIDVFHFMYGGCPPLGIISSLSFPRAAYLGSDFSLSMEFLPLGSGQRADLYPAPNE